MQIVCTNICKKFNKHYIIKDFTYTFITDSIIGIKGSNGSGKSTLLKMISSVLTPTSGSIKYKTKNSEFSITQIRNKFSFVAPAVELLETLTVEQTINFHFEFQTLKNLESSLELMKVVWLENQRNTLISNLSSGMKQRLKLGLAFYSNVEYILLDEPTSNLDKEGIDWFQNLLLVQKENRGIIIASNEERDFLHCNKLLNVLDFK